MTKASRRNKSIPGFILPKADAVLRTSPIGCMHCYYAPLIKRLYRRRMKLICELIGPRRYGTALDIGFGGGTLFPTLAHVSARLFGVDFHPLHRRVADLMREHHGIGPLLIRGKLPNLPLKDVSVDAVFSLSNLYYLGSDLEESLDEIGRIARPGGHVYLGTSSPLFYRLFLMRTAYRAFPPIRKNVYDSIRRHFNVEETKTIPSHLPVVSSLFFCCRCTPIKKD